MNDRESEWLAERFEAHRSRLRGVAYRMLGSLTEADDAVQDTWLRVSRDGAGDVENLGGWLTTIVARVCLNMLRTRGRRREESLEARLPDPVVGPADELQPEDEALLADSVGLALQVVLDTLSPAERLSFVLHDMFDLPFEEIAPMVGRSNEAARQLASRARRRVRGAEIREADQDPGRQREVVDAFFRAARGGDMEGLIAVLDPDVVLRADYGPRRPLQVFHGAEAVAPPVARHPRGGGAAGPRQRHGWSGHRGQGSAVRGDELQRGRGQDRRDRRRSPIQRESHGSPRPSSEGRSSRCKAPASGPGTAVAQVKGHVHHDLRHTTSPFAPRQSRPRQEDAP